MKRALGSILIVILLSCTQADVGIKPLRAAKVVETTLVPPPESRYVTTVAELKQAFKDQVSYVKITGTIDLQGEPIFVPDLIRPMHILGYDGAEIIFNHEYSGTARNGMEFRNGNIIIRNVIFSNFNGYGAAIKFNGKGNVAVVDHCIFKNIGDKEIGPKLHTQAIAAHTGYNTFIITNNLFQEVATNEPDLSHCHYLTNVTFAEVHDNVYIQTGNTDGVLAAIKEINNNIYIQHKDNTYLWINKEGLGTFWKNEIKDSNFILPIRITVPGNIFADCNDYQLKGPPPTKYCVWYNVGNFTWEQWREIQEPNSVWSW
jgi:uncharacterized pyridoxamine 5'-phosphate oxidase family protein